MSKLRDSAWFFLKGLGFNTLVEGGTYHGQSAIIASKIFDQVITIEKFQENYDIAKKNLSNHKNITLLLGDTRDHLKDDAHLLGDAPILYWLDSHWCGSEDTYGLDDECPLLEELNIILSKNKRCVILIDDARLFLEPPIKPHVSDSWPTVDEIVRTLPTDWMFVVHSDIICLVPGDVRIPFKRYLEMVLTHNEHKRMLKEVFEKAISGTLNDNELNYIIKALTKKNKGLLTSLLVVCDLYKD